MNDALELRSENHVHESNRQKERPDEFHQSAFHLAASSGDGSRIRCRHVHVRRCFPQRVESVRQGVTRRHRGPQRNNPLPINPVDSRWTSVFFDRHQIVEAHQTAARRGHVETRDGRRIAAIAIAQAQLDVVVFIHRRVAEARDLVVAANHQTQGIRNVGRVDAEISGARAINVDAQLRLVQFQRRVGIDNPPEFFRFQTQVLGILRQL